MACVQIPLNKHIHGTQFIGHSFRKALIHKQPSKFMNPPCHRFHTILGYPLSMSPYSPLYKSISSLSSVVASTRILNYSQTSSTVDSYQSNYL